IKLTSFFSFGNLGSKTCRSEKGWDTTTGSFATLCQGSLGYKFNFHFATQHLTFKFCVLTNVRGDHFFYLMFFQKKAKPKIINASIIGNTGYALNISCHQFIDYILRNTAKSKTSQHKGHSILNALTGFTDV